MFNKRPPEEETTTVDKPQPRLAPEYDTRGRSVSVIGPTLRFKGELSANEDLVIEGQIEGTIAHQNKNLTVGKNGRVKADIHAKMVEVLGEVNGDIRGDDIVRLSKSAVVNGNIRCARIVMEDGAHFSGNIEMAQPKDDTRSAGLSVAEGAARAKTIGS
ncbi:MAG: bactofilin family protein [Woeseiaceae bacterium]